jgi:hypothetical protein
MMASLGYAAGGIALGDEHFGELVRALIDDQHEVVWSGAWPSCVPAPAPALHDLGDWT